MNSSSTHTENTNELGRRFTQALAAKKMTPAALARELGALPQRVNHWKNRGVAARYAVRVGEILDISPELIAGLVAEAPRKPLVDRTILHIRDGKDRRTIVIEHGTPFHEAWEALQVAEQKLLALHRNSTTHHRQGRAA